MKKRTLLVGFGNEMFDWDSCAKLVIGEAVRRCNVEARWLGRGVHSLLWLAQSYDTLVVVDSSLRLEPGRVVINKLDYGRCESKGMNLSLHEDSVEQVLCEVLGVSRGLEIFMVECGVRPGIDPRGVAHEAIKLLEKLGFCGEAGGDKS